MMDDKKGIRRETYPLYFCFKSTIMTQDEVIDWLNKQGDLRPILQRLKDKDIVLSSFIWWLERNRPNLYKNISVPHEIEDESHKGEVK